MMFELKRTLSRSSMVDEHDMAAVQFALVALGYYTDDQSKDFPTSSRHLYAALEAYQAAKGMRVNGEMRQDGQVKDMIFDIPTLIETCSRGITLYPGDVIATGSPAGVGMGMKPPRYLKAGDVVRIEVDGLGVIENKFV